MAGILSITGSVLGIISAIAKLATQVHETMQEYKMASSTLAAINNECAVLSATMNTLGRLSRKHRAKITNQSLGLTQPFNASLLACETTLVALTREIQRLGFIGKTKHEWIPLVRMKYIWNEKTIKDLLEQLRWQGQTLNLLINTIQLSSLDAIQNAIEGQQTSFQQIVESAQETLERYFSDEKSVNNRGHTYVESIYDNIDALISMPSRITIDFDKKTLSTQEPRASIHLSKVALAALAFPVLYLSTEWPTRVFSQTIGIFSFQSRPMPGFWRGTVFSLSLTAASLACLASTVPAISYFESVLGHVWGSSKGRRTSRGKEHGESQLVRFYREAKTKVKDAGKRVKSMGKKRLGGTGRTRNRNRR